MRWEERYSSSEMMYVEVTAKGVRVWLNSHEGDFWSFQEVLDGALDNEVGGVFGSDVLAEVRAAAREEWGRQA